MIRKVAARALPFAISAIILAALVRRTTATDLKAVLMSASAAGLSACAAMLMLAFSLRACRWRYIVRSKGVDLSLLNAMKVQATGVALNLVAPGGSGNVLRAYYATKWVGNKECMLSTNVANTLVSLAFATALGAAAAGVLGYACVGLLYAGVSACLFGVLTLRWPLLWRMVGWAAAKAGRSSWSAESLTKYAQIAGRDLLVCGGLSALILLCESGILYFALVAINLDAKPLLVAAYFPACMLANMLPITVSGLGSFEAVVSFLAQQFGGVAAAGLVASFLFRCIAAIPALPGIWLIVRTDAR